ncbi:MAG: hypothetical protein N2512_02570 [Armatimonadetes bacterium]|nr:hypothetical protein [Armatimonadota bacterium]
MTYPFELGYDIAPVGSTMANKLTMRCTECVAARLQGNANVGRGRPVRLVRGEVLLRCLILMAIFCTVVSASQAGDQFRRVGWNTLTKQIFMHPPVFSFSTVPEAASYQLSVSSANGEQHVLVSATPEFSLESIWERLPAGEDFRVDAIALDRSGETLGQVQFTFYKKLPFEGKTLPPRSDYLAAGFKCAEFMMDTLAGRRAELCDYAVKPGGKAGWPGLFYSAQIRLLALYARLGPPERREEALRGISAFTDWLLARTSPEDWAWPHCPPTQDIHGSDPVIQPSRLGMLGDAFLDALEVKYDKRLLDATLKMAETLKARQLPDGRWPFRVDARTGQTIIDYTSDQIEVALFLDRLITDYGRNDLQDTVDRAIHWMIENPCKNYRWENQYDDMGGFEPYQGLEWLDTGFMIVYLLRHRNESNSYLSMAHDLLRYIDDQFIEWRFSPTFVMPSAREQYACYSVIDYHVAHYIKICLAFHQATGDDTYLEKAKVMGNTLTNLQHPDGWFACQDAKHTGDPSKPGVVGEVQFTESWGPNYLPNCSAYAGEMLMRLGEYLRQAELREQHRQNP